jgi:hypothetical protein
MMTSGGCRRVRSSSVAANPSIRGIRMSISTTSGLVPVDGGDDLGAVGDLGHDANVLHAGEHHRQAGADQGVVVDDQHPDG